jgi:branched-subunit amino acid ABC-type transport system permease component
MGAVLGGLLLGILEAIGTTFVGSGWKDVFAYSILITMIVFRPQGLFGDRE